MFAGRRIEIRKQRLKEVFEGRKKKLNEVRNRPRGEQHQFNYADAVRKYDRARRAWRAFRGWV